ncbi:MAG: ferritin [Tissierellia bacterium]|nr:ferritin [Tissierellia bacterium]
MVSEKLLTALNDQFNFELESAYVYMAMAAYCSDEDYDGFSHFFIMQAQEEYQHAMKFYDFIYDVDGSVELKAIPQPEGNYESVLAAFKEALAHEELVTSKINKIMDIAVEENNRFTINFLQWFIEEQLEEENSMKKIISTLERIDGNFQGMYMLDKELGQRVLEPIE